MQIQVKDVQFPGQDKTLDFIIEFVPASEQEHERLLKFLSNDVDVIRFYSSIVGNIIRGRIVLSESPEVISPEVQSKFGLDGGE